MEITDLMTKVSSTLPTTDSTPETPREAYEAAIDKMVAGVDVLDKERFNERSSTVLSKAVLNNKKVVIIGAGGLGNWQWKTLLGMGFTCITIMDDDVVSPENIGPQAHRMIDIGMKKVDAIAQEAYAYKGVRIRAIDHRCPNKYWNLVEDLGFVPDIVIGCTDNREWRNDFLESLSENDFSLYNDKSDLPELWIDLRMSMGTWDCYTIPVRGLWQVYTEADDDGAYSKKHHIQALMSKYCVDAYVKPEEAIQEPCTARAICFTGESVAAHVGALLFNWYNLPRELRTDFDFLTYFIDGSLRKMPEFMHVDIADCLYYHVHCNSVRAEYTNPGSTYTTEIERLRLVNLLAGMALRNIDDQYAYRSLALHQELTDIVNHMSHGQVLTEMPQARKDDKYFYFIVPQYKGNARVYFTDKNSHGIEAEIDWETGNLVQRAEMVSTYEPGIRIKFPVRKCEFMGRWPTHFLSMYEQHRDETELKFGDDNVLYATYNGNCFPANFLNGTAFNLPKNIEPDLESEDQMTTVAVQDLNVGDRAFDDTNAEFIVIDKSNPKMIVVRYAAATKTIKMQGSIKCKICSASLTRDSNTES